jgi:hypothetical protein
MSETKLYSVRLVKGFSFTSNGRTFYQNRPLKAMLSDEEANKLRAMESGSKFQVIAVTTEPATPPAVEPPAVEPPAVDDDDAPEDLDFDAMTKAEIKAHLDEYGVEYDDRMSKADLIELAESV